MERDAAIQAAKRYAERETPSLVGRDWDGVSFASGWLLFPQGRDLEELVSVPWLVVLDDGSVHRESSSRPPHETIARYSA